MAEKKIIYIGEFPPKYGGVTIKNAMLYEQIYKKIGAKRIDLERCRRQPLLIPATMFQIAINMISAQSVIIGTGAVWRDKLLLLMQRILTGKRGMQKITQFIMGGRYHEFVKQDHLLCRLLKNVGNVWVESEQMITEFQELGITQTYLFPNCRIENGAMEPVRNVPGEPLKLVFFSRICIEKGVEDIIAAYENLGEKKSDITLDFYGELEGDIREDFLKFIQAHENVRYNGIYNATNGDVYTELNQYDVMLNISKREGVAGTLVESKMAGITAIVSNRGFNGEVVHNRIEGIVISEPFAENLVNAITKLVIDRGFLANLKLGAFESRNRYNIETYRQKILDCLNKNEE